MDEGFLGTFALSKGTEDVEWTCLLFGNVEESIDEKINVVMNHANYLTNKNPEGAHEEIALKTKDTYITPKGERIQQFQKNPGRYITIIGESYQAEINGKHNPPLIFNYILTQPTEKPLN